jgi:uncharacterized protein (DUF302 family)
MKDNTPDFGRRIVVDLSFTSALAETCRALREEGLFVLTRFDVRDQFMRDQPHAFRPYEILEVWSPELAFDALSQELDAGLLLPTRIVLYELTDGQTAVLASEPLAPMAAQPRWREDFPALAAVADYQSECVGRVLAQVQHSAAHQPAVPR